MLTNACKFTRKIIIFIINSILYFRIHPRLLRPGDFLIATHTGR